MTTATCWGSMRRVRVRISLRLMLIRSVSESHHLDLLINHKFDIHSPILLDRFTNEFAQAKVQHIWLHVLL